MLSTNDIFYKHKYLKYKNKYLNLKAELTNIPVKFGGDITKICLRELYFLCKIKLLLDIVNKKSLI
jgi:hypothetical protein